MSDAQFLTEISHEVGLRLPDGTHVFAPDRHFHDHDLSTREGRAKLIEALSNSAVNLGEDPIELLERYHWLIRTNRTYTTYVQGVPEVLAIGAFDVIDGPPPFEYGSESVDAQLSVETSDLGAESHE